MLKTRVTCPRCGASTSADSSAVLGRRIRCPSCGEPFVVQGNGLSAPDVPVAAPHAPPPSTHRLTAPPTVRAPVARPFAPPPRSRKLALGLAVGGLALFLLGGTALAVYCATAGGGPGPDDENGGLVASNPFPVLPGATGRKGEAAPAKPPGEPPPEPPGEEAAPHEQEPAHEAAPPPPVQPPAAPVQPVRAAPPDRQKLIDEAIDRGVKYLQARQLRSGTWKQGGHQVGYATLPGLTLLECGVPTTDPRIQEVARYVRFQSGNLKTTYDLSLAILFLDRLGEAKDRPLIQTLAGRLIAGQNEHGGWTYNCTLLSRDETVKLLVFLRQESPTPLPRGIRPGGGGPDLVAIRPGEGGLPSGIARDGPADLPRGIVGSPGESLPTGIGGKGGKTSGSPGFVNPSVPGEGTKKESKRPAKAPEAKKAPRLRLPQLPPAVRNLPVLTGRPRLAKGQWGRPVLAEDNSNSQFAMMALWVARRHDVPVERTMALVLKRYHASQNRDGGWSYHTDWAPKSRGRALLSRPSMTCVGLLGLAMGHGSAQEVRGAAPGKKGKDAPASQDDPAIQRGLKRLGTWVGSPSGGMFRRLELDLYALWSVERVAVLYNLKTIGGRDWYGWAVEMLLPNQRPDGSWRGPPYPGNGDEVVDTCFALLILKRANLVQDLSDNLRLYMAITDPDAAPNSRK